MYTIQDYLQFRGDLSFKVSSFNEVDNLLLTQLSYVDLSEIVPSTESYITLKEASAKFFEKQNREMLLKSKAFTRQCPFIMEQMAQTKRFENIRLSHYEDSMDEENYTQFSAMHINLLDGTIYLSFRGTDDSLVGWYEDFQMLYDYPIEGQKRAVEYVNNTVKWGLVSLRFGGHSKGGNLAVYAAALCKPSIQRRITQVFNNDGPGFWKAFIESEEYQRIVSKVISIVPQGSIFGLMLEHREENRVVKSNASGAMQHDVLSWGINGISLDYADSLSEDALHFKDSLNKWLAEHSEEQRKKVTEAIIQLIDVSGSKNVSEFLGSNLKTINSIVLKFTEFDSDTRNLLLSVFGLIGGEYNRGIISSLKKMIEKK